jgi:CO dehydrogenase/acetyl-CoA synthase beta subunit
VPLYSTEHPILAGRLIAAVGAPRPRQGLTTVLCGPEHDGTSRWREEEKEEEEEEEEEEKRESRVNLRGELCVTSTRRLPAPPGLPSPSKRSRDVRV